jgi:hypothetical protein
MTITHRLAGLALGLITLGATVGVAHADPAGPQRLRGLDGRIFLVDVKPIDDPLGPTIFSNCYTFGVDGGWIDAVVPTIPFVWEQTSTGASTDYTVFDPTGAEFQTGHIGPANGGGSLELRASTPVTPLGPLYSFGHEVAACPDGVPDLAI